MMQSFQWGSGGRKITSPEQAARQRAIAEALMMQGTTPAANIGQGLADVTAALSGSVLNNEVLAAEEAGGLEASGLFSGLSSSSPQADIIAALNNPWASDDQSSVARALLGSQLEAVNSTPSSPYLNVGGGMVFDTSTGQYVENPFAGGETAQNLPADLQEYEFYRQQAEAAGQQPLSYLEFVQAQRGAGLSVQTNPDGTTTVTQGGPMKMTEQQSKDNVYAFRAEGALPVIDELENSLLSLGENVAENAGVIGNYLQSEDYQKARNAGREFLASILRKDTGAAVTPSEEELYGQMYLPKPGDKPGTVAQKRLARKRALEAIKMGLPPEQVLRLEQASMTSKSGPVVVDGFTIEAVD